MPTNEIDHEFTDEPVCPACGCVIDSADFRGDRAEWDCPGCGVAVVITADFSVTYTTKLKEKLADADAP